MKSLTQDDFKNINNPQRDIYKIINELQYDNEIKIIYATLVGSRINGLKRKDSDYNIRFIYRQPLENYLVLGEKKDTIIYDEPNYNVIGWDIDKTLKEHFNSSLELQTWIRSPIKYVQDTEIRFNRLTPFDRNYILHEYATLTENNFKSAYKDMPNFLTDEDLKKYLYSIYYLCSWNILYYEQKTPPLKFKELLKQSWKMPEYLFECIHTFFKSYKTHDFKIGYHELSNVNAWLYNQIKIMKNTTPIRYPKRVRIYYYEKIFRELIKKPII